MQCVVDIFYELWLKFKRKKQKKQNNIDLKNESKKKNTKCSKCCMRVKPKLLCVCLVV